MLSTLPLRHFYIYHKNIKNSNLNNVDFYNSKIEVMELYNNKNVSEVYLYSSKIEMVKGSMENMRGFYMSLEQILDLVKKIGINLHE